MEKYVKSIGCVVLLMLKTNKLKIKTDKQALKFCRRQHDQYLDVFNVWIQILSFLFNKCDHWVSKSLYNDYGESLRPRHVDNSRAHVPYAITKHV